MPKIYDPSGQFVRQAARKGQGPGELTSPVEVLALPGDSVLIIDNSRLRALLFGPDLRMVRELTVPRSTGRASVVAWPDKVAIHGLPTFGAPENRALRMVAFDAREGRELLSFGHHVGSASMFEANRDFFQILASPTRSTVWAAPRLEYRLDEWSPTGTLLRSLRRQPTWFPGAAQPDAGAPTAPPPPAVRAITVDNRGYVWVFVSVPSPRWREAEFVPRTSVTSPPTAAWEKLYRTNVEVIDPRAGTVVARRELETWIIAALPEGQVAAYEVDADDMPVVVIYDATLAGIR